VITKTSFGASMLETLKACPDARAALRDRIQSIETELTQLSGTRKEWAEKWDRLLSEFFDLKERLRKSVVSG
jgi:hypothetical protein